MSIIETLKAKFAELKADPRFARYFADAERAVQTAVTKAGTLAHDKRAEIDGYAEKAATLVNSRTEGKYADQVAKARTKFAAGVDKLAEKHPDRHAA